MASAKVADGFTQFPDGLLESLAAAPLPARHGRVALSLVRLTYGYQKARDRISSGQIEKITGIASRHVRQILCELAEWNVITREGKPGTIQTIGFVIDLETWSIPAPGDPGRTRKGPDLPREGAGPPTGQPQRGAGPLPTQPGPPAGQVSGPPTGHTIDRETNHIERSALDLEILVNLLSKEPGERRAKLAWLEAELPNIELLADFDAGGDASKWLPAVRSRVLRHYRQHRRGGRSLEPQVIAERTAARLAQELDEALQKLYADGEIDAPTEEAFHRAQVQWKKHGRLRSVDGGRT